MSGAEGNRPATSDPLALVQARLGAAFTAVSALADAVDVLPSPQAKLLRPSTAAAFGALTECEDAVEHLVARGVPAGNDAPPAPGGHDVIDGPPASATPIVVGETPGGGVLAIDRVGDFLAADHAACVRFDDPDVGEVWSLPADACGWAAHVECVDEVGWCPVCQHEHQELAT